MTKQEFLDRLDGLLADLPPEDRAGTLEFYAEQIEDRMDDGLPEAEAVAALESPEAIAAAIAAQPRSASETPSAPDPAGANEAAKRRSHAARTVLAVAATPVLALGVVLLAALLLTLWACVAAVASAGLAAFALGALTAASLVTAPPASAAVAAATVGLALAGLGAAVLLWVLTFLFGKLLMLPVAWTARFIARRLKTLRNRLGKQQAQDEPDAPAVQATPQPDAPAPSGRRRPMVANLATGSLAVVLAGICLVGAGMGSAGGVDEFMRRAGTGELVGSIAIPGNQVRRIDVSPTGYNRYDLSPSIQLGASPDQNVYIIGASRARAYTLTSVAGDVPRQVYATSLPSRASGQMLRPVFEQEDGATKKGTVTLRYEHLDGWYLENPFALVNASQIQVYCTLVLLPEGWQGDLVSTDDRLQISTMGPYVSPDASLPYYLRDYNPNGVIDIFGNISLVANEVSLYNVEAHSIYLKVPDDNMSDYALPEGYTRPADALLVRCHTVAGVTIDARYITLDESIVHQTTVERDDSVVTVK